MAKNVVICSVVGSVIVGVIIAWTLGYHVGLHHTSRVPTIVMLQRHTFGLEELDVPYEETLVNYMFESGILPTSNYVISRVSKENISTTVESFYNHGVRIFVGILLSSDLARLETFVKQHDDCIVISTASTASRFSSIPNMIRLATPDSRTITGWQFLANNTMVGRDVVISTSPGDVWSTDLSEMLQEAFEGIAESVAVVEEPYLSSISYTGQMLVSLTTDLNTFVRQHMSHEWLQADIVFGDVAAYVAMPNVTQWQNSTNMKAFVISNNARDVGNIPRQLFGATVSPYISELVRALQIASTIGHLYENGVFADASKVQQMYGVFATNLLDEGNNRFTVQFEFADMQFSEVELEDLLIDGDGRALRASNWVHRDQLFGNGKYAGRTCREVARIMVQENDGISWFDWIAHSEEQLRQNIATDCNSVRDFVLSNLGQYGFVERDLPYLPRGEFANWPSCEDIGLYRSRRGDDPKDELGYSVSDRRLYFVDTCKTARHKADIADYSGWY